MQFINVVLAADDNYAQHVSVVIASIMANTKEDVRFFLLSNDISEKKLNLLCETANSLGAIINVIDLTKYDKFNNLYTSGHISKTAYFRIDIANILPNDVKKIIYLDVDLLVLDDINKLWNFDMKSYPVAAVADYGIMASKRLRAQKQNCIGFDNNISYFNSGVMIFNLSLWRKYDYAEKVLQLAYNSNFRHHDQDALNKIFKGNWGHLPLRWNVIPPVYNLHFKVVFNKIFRKNAVEAKNNIAILHYAGRYKPWEFVEYDLFNKKYYEYLDMTKFKDFPMPQPSKNMKGKSIIRQLIRAKFANILCKIFACL